jgi:alpha-methylacyl-CoA racemase
VTNSGPLAGVKVIELGGIGPGPHTAMVLADLGADVVRVRRPGGLQMPAEHVDLMHRGKRSVDLDVKKEPQALLDLAAKADVLLDCFRPGTCERAWHRSRRLRGGQSAADLRADHRVGTGRAAGDDGGP